MRKPPVTQPPADAVIAIAEYLTAGAIRLGGGDHRFILRCVADARSFGAELIFTDARLRQWDALMLAQREALLELAAKRPSLRLWIMGAGA